nr:hypothetical protein [Tessaracoccus sp. MC1627]
MGADPGLVQTAPAGVAAGGGVNTGRGAGSHGVLSLERIKGTGFRPGNAWLELIDHLPRRSGGSARAGADVGSEAGAEPAAALRRARTYTVLFVCTANICRSAYADVAARSSAPEGIAFVSAGTRALVGEGMDPPMAAELKGRGEPEAHLARQLTRSMVEEADLILTMAPEHRRYILDEWPTLGRKAFVIGHASRVVAELPKDLRLDGVVDYLWHHRTSEAGDEVADPYRRGEQAAEVAARSIDAHLDVIVGALSRLDAITG